MKEIKSYTVLSVGNNVCSSKKIQRGLLKFNVGIVNTPLLITAIQFEELLRNLKPDLIILNLDADEAIDFAKFANAFKIPHVYLTSSSSKIKIAKKTNPWMFFRVPISDDEFIYNVCGILEFTFLKGVKKDPDTEGVSEKTAPRPASEYRLIQRTMSKSDVLKIDQLLFFKSDGVHVNVTCKQIQF